MTTDCPQAKHEKGPSGFEKWLTPRQSGTQSPE